MNRFFPIALMVTMVSVSAQEATSLEIVNWGTATDPAGDCKFAVNDETLMITIPGTHHDLNPGTAFGNNMLAPRVLNETIDHFTLDVTVDPLEHPKPATSSSSGETKHSYVGAGLLVWKDEKNFVRFERAVNGDSKNVFIQLEVFINGEVIYSRGAACNDEPVQLRIVRKGRTFTFFRSDDGKDWKRVALVQVPLTGQMQCGVMAVNATTSEFKPVFSKLSITALAEPHRDQ